LTICRLADRLPLAKIPQIAYQAEGRIGLPAARASCEPEIADLDRLPFPDWSVFELSRYAGTSRLFYDDVPVGPRTSRGCRAQCVFCSKGVFGSTWRGKSPRRGRR